MIAGAPTSRSSPLEQTIYVARPHWIVFRKPVFAAIVLIVMLALRLRVHSPLLLVPTGVALLYGIAKMGNMGIYYHFARFTVTNRRVIYQSGWIGKRRFELLLRQIETVDVGQGLLGRIFDFGTVTVRGTGTTWTGFAFTREPNRLRAAISTALDTAATPVRVIE